MKTHLEFIRDAAKEMPLSSVPFDIRTAKIWHCKYRTLKPLAGLVNLEELVIAGFPDDSLDFLGELAELRYLSITHLPRVGSLAPLAVLTKLHSLSLATLPSWDSSKRTVVDSLEPLTRLPALRHLELFGICASDRSLAALEQCTHLQSVRVGGYTRTETARFYAATSFTDEYMPQPGFER